jgi:hypothetical protein
MPLITDEADNHTKQSHMQKKENENGCFRIKTIT